MLLSVAGITSPGSSSSVLIMRGKGGVDSGNPRVAAWMWYGSTVQWLITYQVEQKGGAHLRTFAFYLWSPEQLSLAVPDPHFVPHMPTTDP